MTARVAVVGGGVGGMTAAGVLAARGLSVTLFEASGALGGKARVVRTPGVVLDTGPTLVTLPHVLRDTFESLGASDLMPELIELDLQCAYRWDDGTAFSARRELERTLEAARRFGEREALGLGRFYAAAEDVYRVAGEPYLSAPYQGPWGYAQRMAPQGLLAIVRGAPLRTLHDFAKRFVRDPKLRQFAGRFATYAGASPHRASAAFAMIAHIERAFGVHHPRGGVGAVVSGLGRALERLGVRVLLDQRAAWTREADGWRVGPPGCAERFDAVVVNADPQTQQAARQPQSLSGYVLLLEASARLRMPHHMVVFSRDDRAEFAALFAGQLPDHPTVYFCHPAATDPTLAAPDRSGVYAMVNAPCLPTSDPADWSHHAARLRALCLDTLRRHVPDARAARLTVVGEQTPVELAGLGAPRGSIYGFLPHGLFAPFRRPRMRAPEPGLFYAGGGTHPGGGLPLVMRSGRFAADMVGEHLGARVASMAREVHA